MQKMFKFRRRSICSGDAEDGRKHEGQRHSEQSGSEEGKKMPNKWSFFGKLKKREENSGPQYHSDDEVLSRGENSWMKRTQSDHTLVVGKSPRPHTTEGTSGDRSQNGGKFSLEVETEPPKAPILSKVAVDLDRLEMEREAGRFTDYSKSAKVKEKKKSRLPTFAPTVNVEDIGDVEDENPDGENCGSGSEESEEEATNSSDGNKGQISFLELVGGPATWTPTLSPRSNYLDHSHSHTMDVAPSPPTMQFELNNNKLEDFNKLTKRLCLLKKRLCDLEKDYEAMYGYKPSHADKVKDKEMKKVMAKVGRVKKEMGALKEPHSLSVGHQPSPKPSLTGLSATVQQIHTTLESHRNQANRPSSPSDMTLPQLKDEKAAIQRQLLVLERKHGRPDSKEEKEVVRTLYDRYRRVKRKSESFSGMGTIKEHVVLDVAESPRPQMQGLGSFSEDDEAYDEQADDDKDEDIVNIGKLDLGSLVTKQSHLRQEKHSLRSAIKKFETEFRQAAGRKPTKTERASSVEIEDVYIRYKKVKKTLRLVEVLIAKEGRK